MYFLQINYTIINLLPLRKQNKKYTFVDLENKNNLLYMCKANKNSIRLLF